MDNNYAIIENGVVVNVVVWNGDLEIWQPPEGMIAVLIPDGVAAGIGSQYDGTNFVQMPPPKPTPEQILASNTSTRDTLLSQAALAIAPLQDAVDLDEATDAEAALLKKWKQYRVAVNRVDLTRESPVWPTAPTA